VLNSKQIISDITVRNQTLNDIMLFHLTVENISIRRVQFVFARFLQRDPRSKTSASSVEWLLEFDASSVFMPRNNDTNNVYKRYCFANRNNVIRFFDYYSKDQVFPEFVQALQGLPASQKKLPLPKPEGAAKLNPQTTCRLSSGR